MKKAYTLLSTAFVAGVLTLGVLSPNPIRADQEAKMKGTISTINHVNSRVEITTDKGPVQIYFVPEMIKDLKAGDKVEVALELEKISSNTGTAHEQGMGAVYKRDMEERFPHTTKPDEDIAKKSKQIGS
jgi:hypothetical protein